MVASRGGDTVPSRMSAGVTCAEQKESLAVDGAEMSYTSL